MQLWHEFLESIAPLFGKPTIDTWVRTLTVLAYDESSLKLEAQDSFQAIWFKEHIKPLLKQKFLTARGTPFKVTLHIKNEKKGVPKEEDAQQQEGPLFPTDPLEAHSHFSQYVADPTNEMPFKLFSNLVGYNGSSFETPTLTLSEFNPIYLYGPSGVGKTHLVMALCSALKNKGHTAIYVKAETFTDHVIQAYRNTQINEFRATYRNVDCLIVDDIHILARKTTTQEELFHTFNHLHTRGKQIIFTANCAPRELGGIEERLISRFEWGIALPLNKLGEQQKVTILRKRANMLQFPLNELTEEYMLETFVSHTPLTKALEALVLRCHVDSKYTGKSSRSITPDDVNHLLADFIQLEKKHAITPEKLVKIVARSFRVTTDDILGKSKAKEFVVPRQVAMYFCRTELNLPYLKIGSIFTRDHSTVMSSVKQIEKKLKDQDSDIASSIGSVQKQLIA